MAKRSRQLIQGGVRAKACLAIAAFALALGGGELAIRTIGVAPPIKAITLSTDDCVYQRSDNPVLGFELRSNYRNAAPDFIDSYERTNSYGQRDIEHPVPKPAGTRRILLLGDSVVEGYGLPQSQTISSVLRELFADGTEILNFGVSAYCTLAEIELLAVKGLRFQPDVVVLVFVENDFDDFNREAFPLGSPRARPALAEWLFQHTHLFRLACLEFDLFDFRSYSDPVRWNREAIGDNNVTRGLRRFRKLADEHGFQPLIAVWPRFLQDRVVDSHPIPESEQLIVEALAAEAGIPSFRLSPFFQAAMHGTSTPVSPRLQFSQGDELHPSAMGARIAAEAIHQVLTAGVDQLEGFDPHPEAQAALAKLKLETPNYARVYNRIGNEHLKRDELMEAMEQYERALAEDPQNAAAHNNLGIALERAELPGAEIHYRRAIELESDFAEAHFNLGNRLEESSPETARDHFIKAIQIKPDFITAHYALSRSLLRAGRRQAAEAGLREVLKRDANHADALLLLAGELARQQRMPEARAFFERFVKLQPNHAEALNNLGVVALSMGDSAAAVDCFRRAVAADPEHPKAAQNLRTAQGVTETAN